MDAKENQWEPVEDQREARGVHEDQWESMKVYENLCKSMKNAWILITFVGSSMTARADLEKLWKLKGATKPNLTESMQIGGCPAGSKICEKIKRDLPKSTKINEKSMPPISSCRLSPRVALTWLVVQFAWCGRPWPRGGIGVASSAFLPVVLPHFCGGFGLLS